MTTTPTKSTVSAEQAREAVERIEHALTSSADDASEHVATLDSFIAQHSAEPVAAGWRLLEAGEVIREGDEAYDHEGRWIVVGPQFGDERVLHGLYRRRFAAQGQTP